MWPGRHWRNTYSTDVLSASGSTNSRATYIIIITPGPQGFEKNGLLVRETIQQWYCLRHHLSLEPQLVLLNKKKSISVLRQCTGPLSCYKSVGTDYKSESVDILRVFQISWVIRFTWNTAQSVLLWFLILLLIFFTTIGREKGNAASRWLKTTKHLVFANWNGVCVYLLIEWGSEIWSPETNVEMYSRLQFGLMSHY